MSREKSEPVFPQLPPPVAGTIGAMRGRIGDTHPTIAAIVTGWASNSSCIYLQDFSKAFQKSYSASP